MSAHTDTIIEDPAVRRHQARSTRARVSISPQRHPRGCGRFAPRITMTIASAASGAAGAATVLPELPEGLEPWIAAWIRQVEEETRVLRENGAELAAAARCRVVVQFIAAAREWLDAEVDVAEAAEAT
jgi:hypothetical protein